MRGFIFVAGLVVLVSAVLNYSDATFLPVDFGDRTIMIGSARFRVDVALMVVGILMMLLGFPSKRTKWR
jgi:hypothetical protein